MPGVKIDDTLRMHYEIDNFVEPWITPEVIMLVHGMGDSTATWYAWVPRLARKYRVVRIDLRGFGKSSVPPEGYQWSAANFARDVKIFLDKIGVEKVHLVGAKIGGATAFQFAHDYPQRLHSLTAVGTPAKFGRESNVGKWLDTIRTKGVAGWARDSMPTRLGTNVSTEMVEWFVQQYDRTSHRVMIEVLTYVETADIRSLLPHIKVPTLTIVGKESDFLGTTDATTMPHKLMPNCQLVALPTDSYHVAVTEPDACVSALLSFLEKLPRQRQRGQVKL